MNQLRSVCVYCGSSKGNLPGYEADAVRLAEMFVENNITLINGGGSIGLMGTMADTMMSKGGKAVGVIPVALKEKEVAHLGMTDLHVVPDMHSRKLMMVNLSDAFIALPGGFGTMDEVFETLTWAQLHLHRKPIALYNPNGYYDHLLLQADRMVLDGFLSPAARTLLISTADLHQLLHLLVSFQPPVSDKWTFPASRS